LIHVIGNVKLAISAKHVVGEMVTRARTWRQKPAPLSTEHDQWSEIGEICRRPCTRSRRLATLSDQPNGCWSFSQCGDLGELLLAERVPRRDQLIELFRLILDPVGYSGVITRPGLRRSLLDQLPDIIAQDRDPIFHLGGRKPAWYHDATSSLGDGVHDVFMSHSHTTTRFSE
jgi:hypothetical protein